MKSSSEINATSWDKVAKEYQEAFMDKPIYNVGYEIFYKLLKPGASILEIGCGPGNISKYMVSKRPDLRIDGIDISASMISLAKQNIPEADFQVMDCRDVRKLNQKFDGIVCGFCMPYLNIEDCKTLISDCASLLAENGAFYLSVIEGNYSKSGIEKSSDGRVEMFVHYYDQDFLQKQFTVNNLILLDIERILYENKNGITSTHLVLIGKKF